MTNRHNELERLAIVETRVTDLERRAEATDQRRQQMWEAINEIHGAVVRLETKLSALCAQFEAHRQTDARILKAVNGGNSPGERVRHFGPWVAAGVAVGTVMMELMQRLWLP